MYKVYVSWVLQPEVQTVVLSISISHIIIKDQFDYGGA